MTTAAMPHPHHRPYLAMACGTLAYMCYTMQDVLVSQMGMIYPPLQVTWIDMMVALWIVVAVAFTRKGVAGLKAMYFTHQPRLHLLRAILFAVGTAMVFSALPYVRLPQYYVVIFLAPLLAAAFSGVFLKEPVNIQKLAALLLGFVGVVVALQPGPEGFNLYLLLIVGAAGMFGCNGLLNRFLAKKDPSVVLMSYPITISVVLLSVPVLLSFQPVEIKHFLPMGLMGVFLAMAMFLNARSFRYAPVYVNAPCQFLQFVWGGLAQLVLYGTWPRQSSIIGAILIIGSNLLILFLQYRNQDKESA
jgi:drug/metabolite transporter (DMT)-like permease